MMWLVLILASFCELGFTVCMKLSDGFKNKKFTILTIIISAMSIFLLSQAMKTLPMEEPEVRATNQEEAANLPEVEKAVVTKKRKLKMTKECLFLKRVKNLENLQKMKSLYIL